MHSRIIISIIAFATANDDILSASAFIPTATIQQQQRHAVSNTKVVKSPSVALHYHPEQPPLYNGNNDPMKMNNEYYDLDLEIATQEVSRAYERGVECANNFGLCEIDEVLDLSEGEFELCTLYEYHCYESDFRISTVVTLVFFSFTELTHAHLLHPSPLLTIFTSLLELDSYLDCFIGNSPDDCQAEVDVSTLNLLSSISFTSSQKLCSQNYAVHIMNRIVRIWQKHCLCKPK